MFYYFFGMNPHEIIHGVKIYDHIKILTSINRIVYFSIIIALVGYTMNPFHHAKGRDLSV